MDERNERDSVKREADAARKRMNEITGELGERANVKKRMTKAVKTGGRDVKNFVTGHPVAMGIAGGLVGLALGALLPVSKGEKKLIDRLATKLDEMTANMGAGMGDEDEDEMDMDADVSPDTSASLMDDEEAGSDDDMLAASDDEELEDDDETTDTTPGGMGGGGGLGGGGGRMPS